MARRIDKRSDIKLSLPFLNKEGDLIKPTFSLKVEFYTNEAVKKVFIVDCTYDNITLTYNYECTDCFFKNVPYTNTQTQESRVGPLLIIPLDQPNFQPGILKGTIFIFYIDPEFPDLVQTSVKKIKTGIEII